MSSRGYPCQLNEELITKSESCYFLPSPIDLQLFFLMESKSELAELDYPVVKNIVHFQRDNDAQKKLFKTCLEKLGQKFLVFLEVYHY